MGVVRDFGGYKGRENRDCVWEIGGFGEGDSGTVRDYSVYGELAM